jgi:hypothetical protein
MGLSRSALTTDEEPSRRGFCIAHGGIFDGLLPALRSIKLMEGIVPNNVFQAASLHTLNGTAYTHALALGGSRIPIAGSALNGPHDQALVVAYVTVVIVLQMQTALRSIETVGPKLLHFGRA